jgi:competence protein ComEC
VLSANKGAGFTANQWLENDGEMVDQIAAAARDGFVGAAKMRHLELTNWKIIQLKGKGAEMQVQEACKLADLVILDQKFTKNKPEGCNVIDEQTLRRTGALALWPQDDGGILVQQTETQARLWTRPKKGAPMRLVLQKHAKPITITLAD